MKAATHLAAETGLLHPDSRDAILRTIELYGEIPSLDGITAESLVRRLVSDKKTIQGKVHFVLPDRIGHVVVRSGIGEDQVMAAIRSTLS
jgi:3-dehydroquinate synthase